MSDDVRPILAPQGRSPATASDPSRELDDGTYHIYDSNPVPWWVAVVWLAFIVFAIVYLIRNLID